MADGRQTAAEAMRRDGTRLFKIMNWELFAVRMLHMPSLDDKQALLVVTYILLQRSRPDLANLSHNGPCAFLTCTACLRLVQPHTGGVHLHGFITGAHSIILALPFLSQIRLYL